MRQIRYAVGSPVTGRVTKIETFGAFIEVEEGIEGLLPISEMSHRRIRTPAEIVKEGDTVRLVVLSVDPVARRMSFSLKQADPVPVEETVAPGTPAKPKKKRRSCAAVWISDHHVYFTLYVTVFWPFAGTSTGI